MNSLAVRAIAILGIVAAGAAGTQSQPPAPPSPPQATFTTRVDVVQFDVTVLDKDHRPIRGLTASDFTVLENGTPQPIVAVVPIELPGPALDSAPWMREIDSDVVTNERDIRRLVILSVTVYAFDPAGLSAPRSIGGRDLFASGGVGPKAPDAPTEEDKARQGRDDLMSITGATGGRTVAFTNTPEVAVPGIFEENSLYYMVGFRSADHAKDGHFRRVQVKVNRPDAIVHARSGYFPTPAASKAHTNRVRTPLDSALSTDLPAHEIPLRLSAAAFAVPGSREAAVTIVAAVQLPDAAQAPAMAIATAAFDREYAIRGVYRQTLASSQGGAVVETFSRLPLKPERYEIRLAAEAGGKSGGAKTFVEIPDFGKEPLSLSGLVIERTPSGAVANRELIADLIPIVPTTVREFSRSDRANAFVRVYQRTGAPAEDVTLSWRIVGEDNLTAVERTTVLTAEQFTRSHSADGRFTIPLTELGAGEHLLTVEAVRGDRRSRRDLRFTVH
jgi:hypothetical protein